MFKHIPKTIKSLVTSGKLENAILVSLGTMTPGARDLVQNYLWLRSIVEWFPDSVPSVYYLADGFMLLDKLYFAGKLLSEGSYEDRVAQSVKESGKIKKLLSHLRYLWRNSKTSKFGAQDWPLRAVERFLQELF
jgi:hypothetical protein